MILLANGPLPYVLGVYAVPHGGGSPTTLFGTAMAATGASGLAAAPRNDGILFTALPFGVAQATFQLLHFDRARVLRTLSALPPTFRFVPIGIVDQRGDLLLLNYSADAVEGGIFRWSPPAKTLTTVAPALPNAAAMVEDLLTGDLRVGTASGDVHRLARSGQIVSTQRGVLWSFVNARVKFETHLVDGSVLAAWGNLLRYDPRTGATATLAPLVPGGIPLGLDYNPFHRDHYVTQNVDLQRYDITTGRGVQLW
ncbi:MAG: hypothetical protein JXQ29_16985 [Planctomycetes bacterium]|nr:hypothetical protein [Planctomycetota bacterium]